MSRNWALLLILACSLGLYIFNVQNQGGETKFLPILPGHNDAVSRIKQNCSNDDENQQNTCLKIIEALEGNGEQALSLASQVRANDFEEKAFWLRIAAENGNIDGMGRLGQFYSTYADKHEAMKLRSVFWMKKADSYQNTLPNQKKEHTEITQPVQAFVPEDSQATSDPLHCGEPPWWALFDVRNSTNKGMNLACADIPVLEKEALSGNTEAARSLGDFAGGIESSFYQKKFFAYGMYWAAIDAQNDSKRNAYDYGIYLIVQKNHPESQRHNPDYDVRGKFWLKKAAEAGDEYAKTEYEKLKDQDPRSQWIRK